MALKIPVLGTTKWYLPNDPNIDPETLDPKALLGHNYRPPKSKNGEPLAYIEVKQLSDAAFARAISLQEEEPDNPVNMEFVEHVIRHGVVGWGNIYKGDDPLGEPEFEEGPYGKRLTKRSYEAIIPFLGPHIVALAVHLYMLTLPPT